jgi:hypothetical protein
MPLGFLSWDGIGAIEIVILFVVIFALAGVFHRRPARERSTGRRLMLLGCGVVSFGAMAVMLLLSLLAVRVAHVVDLHGPFPPQLVDVSLPTTANASVLEIRLMPQICRQREVKASEIATTLLVLVNEIAMASNDTEESTPRRRSSELHNWEKTPVRTDGRRPLTLKDVARLSRRYPPGGRRSPIEAIVIRVAQTGFAPDSQVYAQILIHESQQLLTAVATSRAASTGGHSFRIAMDGSALILWLPQRAAATESFVSAQLGDSLAHSISAIEIELAVRGWAGQTQGGIAELPEQPDETTHSFGDWLVAVYLAESTLDAMLGANAWPEVRPTIASVERNDRPVAPPAIPEVRTAGDAAVKPPPAPIVEAVAEAEAVQPSAVEAQVVAASPAAVLASTIGGNRPSWVDNPPEQRVDAEGVFRLVGTTQALYATPQESQLAADEVVQELFDQYVRRVYGTEIVGKLRLPREINTSKIVSWTEPQESPTTGMTMYETHVLLALDQNDRHIIEERLQAIEIDRRVHLAGAGSLLVLGLIATLWGYLRLDTASRGYYSGRLKLGAAAAVALVAGAALHVARW